MPTPLAKGIIITVSVIIAAGLAAYESPEVRRWVDKSRRRIAMALHSLGDEISPKVKEPKKHDPSMDEEKTAEAEERRRQARAAIMEKGRILEEQRRKKRESKASKVSDSGFGSFDSLVDEQGNLREDVDTSSEAVKASAVESTPSAAGLTKRNVETTNDAPSRSHESTSSSVQLREMSPVPNSTHMTTQATYEDEMRRNWNLPLPPITTAASETSHASESLIDLTPTSEFPDPDISVPDPSQSEYFSPAASATLAHEQIQSQYSRTQTPSNLPQEHPESNPQSRTISPSPAPSAASAGYYYAHPSAPDVPIPYTAVTASQNQSQRQAPSPILLSSTASTADASDLEHIRASEIGSQVGSSNFSDVGDHHFGESDDENGDGVRTPEGSVWTDVGSEVSGDR